MTYIRQWFTLSHCHCYCCSAIDHFLDWRNQHECTCFVHSLLTFFFFIIFTTTLRFPSPKYKEFALSSPAINEWKNKNNNKMTERHHFHRLAIDAILLVICISFCVESRRNANDSYQMDLFVDDNGSIFIFSRWNLFFFLDGIMFYAHVNDYDTFNGIKANPRDEVDINF